MKDAILEGGSDDPVLAYLIDLTLNEITTERPMFSNPLDEPHFYRKYFKKWVKEGMDERVAEQKRLDEAEAKVKGVG